MSEGLIFSMLGMEFIADKRILSFKRYVLH